jgi:hypothetical protein
MTPWYLLHPKMFNVRTCASQAHVRIAITTLCNLSCYRCALLLPRSANYKATDTSIQISLVYHNDNIECDLVNTNTPNMPGGMCTKIISYTYVTPFRNVLVNDHAQQSQNNILEIAGTQQYKFFYPRV